MEVINFIESHWVLITFLGGILSAFFMFIYALIQAVKCLLRNDILSIYDRCKDAEKITYWQLQSIEMSYKLYKLLRGNSFVDDLLNKIRGFEVID